ncbi:hypothetical protein ACOJBM_16810 [Rhizobium beringeri]|uniref:hypothetical protein n=1 Tax=Rhizobium beringeri TaxID=3019934 RepID=UPI003B5C560B
MLFRSVIVVASHTSSALPRRTAMVICYSESFPKDGLITWARWVDIKEPAAAVVEEAIGWRQRMKE